MDAKLTSSSTRCAFTIVYNGLHHLQHGDFAHNMLKMFDHWIVVDGHALPGGTTSWCNTLKYQSPVSTDGTLEYLRSLGVKPITRETYWLSKDEMVQAAISKLKSITGKCMLWQVDVDEVWQIDQLIANERALKGNVGAVGFHHIVGRCGEELMVARGKWGGDYVPRVWRWEGNQFTSHEPPHMIGQGKIERLPEKFIHFSYYFEKDVAFKAKYYKNHGEIFKPWKDLQRFKPEQFPCHIFRAFGRRSTMGRTNTRIYLMPAPQGLFPARPGDGYSENLRTHQRALEVG